MAARAVAELVGDLFGDAAPNDDSSSDSGSSLVGIVLIVVGGIIAGLYTTWMGRARGQWENVWLQYSLWAMVIFPWAFTAATVEHLSDVISEAHHSAILAAVGFGFCWGWGSVCFGTAVSMVGDSMTFTIVLGLTAALGSVLPLLIQHTSDVKTDKGAYNFGGLAAVLIGIGLTSVAGQQRELDMNADALLQDEYAGEEGDEDADARVQGKTRRYTGATASTARSAKSQSTLSGGFTGRGKMKPEVKPDVDEAQSSNFALGMMVCLASGLLSPCLNFALSFSKNLNDKAEDHGTSKAFAGNPALAFAVTGGFAANAAACCMKLQRNKTWPYFFRNEDEERATNSGIGVTLLVTVTMGAMWFFGTALYNIGADMLGDLGTVLGWPLFMDGMIITANVSGLVRGEWKGSSLRARGFMAAALLVLLGAVVIIAAGS